MLLFIFLYYSTGVLIFDSGFPNFIEMIITFSSFCFVGVMKKDAFGRFSFRLKEHFTRFLGSNFLKISRTGRFIVKTLFAKVDVQFQCNWLILQKDFLIFIFL